MVRNNLDICKRKNLKFSCLISVFFLFLFIIPTISSAIYVFDISTSTYIQNFDVSTNSISPRGLTFNSDGTKMFVSDTSSGDIDSYDLSDAWNVSTASYFQSFDVSSEELFPQALVFNPDGTKMYISGNDADAINEYTLSDAWNISSANFSEAFNVIGQTTSPSGIYFKSDGLKFYIVGEGNIFEYSLSDAWNISSTSYVQNFSIIDREANPQGISFNPDGTQIFVIGFADNVLEYKLSNYWDISTTSYVQNISIVTEEDNAVGFYMRNDGLKMYILGATGKDVNEYNLTLKKMLSINLISPENDTTIFIEQINFSANILDPYILGIQNVTLEVDYSNGTLFYEETNTSGFEGIYNWINISIPFGNWNWNVNAYDDNDEITYTEDFTFINQAPSSKVEIFGSIGAFAIITFVFFVLMQDIYRRIKK